MSEIKDMRDVRTKRKKRRTLLRVVCFVLIAALIVLVIVNRENLTPEAISQFFSSSIKKEETNGQGTLIMSGDILNMSAQKSNVVLTNQSGLCFYSSSGKLIRYVKHNGKNTQTKISGNYVLIYAVGSNEFSVENSQKTLYTVDVGRKINFGDVSKSGRTAIVSDSDIYTSDLTVYDKNGNAVFKWTPASGAITAVSISDDGKYVAAATLYTYGGSIISSIHLFTTTKETPLFSNNFENKMITALDCKSDMISAVCEEEFMTFKFDGSQSGEFSFDGKRIISYGKCKEGTAFVFKDANVPGKSVLTVVDNSAAIKSTVVVDEKVSEMSVYENNIYLLTGNSVLKFDAKTAINRGKHPLDAEAKGLCATMAGTYIVNTLSELEKINL